MSSSSFLAGLFLVLCLLSVSTPASSSTASKLLANDIKVLNFALTLEHLESTFYAELNARFTASDFEAAGYSNLTKTYFEIIGGHEAAHAAALTATINDLGGDPAVACSSYNFSALFPLVNLSDYVYLAYVFESTGTAAYNGQIGNLADTELIQTAASIATVEARQAAYLATLVGESPIFNASVAGSFNPAFNGSTVRAIVAPFLNGSNNCTDVVLPKTIVVIPSRNVTLGNSTSSTNTSNASLRDLKLNDITVLKYALNLEMLERAFYVKFVNQFRVDDFLSAGYSRVVRSYLKIIKYHEKVHAAALRQTINMLGEPAPKPCVYNFSAVTNVVTFLQTAAVLEQTGTSAYDGAANKIYDPTLRQIAATIATIEGRHSSVLYDILGRVPFPNITEPILTPAQVASMVTGFIVSCPKNQTFPIPLSLTVNGTNSTI